MSQEYTETFLVYLRVVWWCSPFTDCFTGNWNQLSFFFHVRVACL